MTTRKVDGGHVVKAFYPKAGEPDHKAQLAHVVELARIILEEWNTAECDYELIEANLHEIVQAGE
jgi:hypothetical protein